MAEKSTPIVVSLNRPKCLGDYWGYDGSPSTGFAIPYINTSSRLPVGHPPWGCRSLSMDGLSCSECKQYREEASELLKLGTYGSILSGSERSRPSQREDILRGYAKVKALEAANCSSSTKNNG